MIDQILKSQEKFYQEQSNQLVVYFKTIFGGCDGRQYPQIITCLNAVYKKGDSFSFDELKDIITDGDGDGGLADAIVFQRNSMDIFNFKERNNLGLREIQKLNHRLDSLVYKVPCDYDSSDIKRVKIALKKWHSPENKRANINIYFVRKKFIKFSDNSEDIKNEVNSIKNKRGINKIEYLDNEKIVNLFLEEDFLKKWPEVIEDEDILLEKEEDKRKKYYEFIILNFKLVSLLKLHDKHKEQGKDLFSQNVRFPENKEKFAKGLLETINKNPNRFFLFHNGIVMTASSIYKNARNLSICSPQIVNGAQTLGNLYKKYKLNLDDEEIKDVTVLCKIIKADQDLTDLICETSNTQKAVGPVDLRTRDSFQKKLEIYIRSESGGKYKYIKKGNKTEKNSIGIQYVKFFQWAYAAFFSKPADAKNARKRLFEKDERGEYENIKTKIENNLSEIIYLCDLGMFIEGKIKKEGDGNKKGFLRSINLYILTGMYLLKSLSNDDFERIHGFLKKYFNEKIKEDDTLNINKIFQQSPNAWIYLKRKLKIK